MLSSVPGVAKPIRCRSRHIFGGAKDFCPNLPKLAQKNSKANDLKKTKATEFHLFWAHFSNESTSSTIFAQISPNFPTKTENIMISKIKKKTKSLHFYFGHHRWKIEAHKAILRRFSHILPNFPQIFKGFCPDFHQIKTSGGALALPEPPPPTPLAKPALCKSRIS